MAAVNFELALIFFVYFVPVFTFWCSNILWFEPSKPSESELDTCLF